MENKDFVSVTTFDTNSNFCNLHNPLSTTWYLVGLFVVLNESLPYKPMIYQWSYVQVTLVERLQIRNIDINVSQISPQSQISKLSTSKDPTQSPSLPLHEIINSNIPNHSFPQNLKHPKLSATSIRSHSKRSLHSASPSLTQNLLLQKAHNIQKRNFSAVSRERRPSTDSNFSLTSYADNQDYQCPSAAVTRPGTPILTPKTKFLHSPDIIYQSTEHSFSRVGSAASILSVGRRPTSCITLNEQIQEESEEESNYDIHHHQDLITPLLRTVTEEEDSEQGLESSRSNLNVTLVPPIVEGQQLHLSTQLPDKHSTTEEHLDLLNHPPVVNLEQRSTVSKTASKKLLPDIHRRRFEPIDRLNITWVSTEFYEGWRVFPLLCKYILGQHLILRLDSYFIFVLSIPIIKFNSPMLQNGWRQNSLRVVRWPDLSTFGHLGWVS